MGVNYVKWGGIRLNKRGSPVVYPQVGHVYIWFCHTAENFVQVRKEHKVKMYIPDLWTSIYQVYTLCTAAENLCVCFTAPQTTYVQQSQAAPCGYRVQHDKTIIILLLIITAVYGVLVLNCCCNYCCCRLLCKGNNIYSSGLYPFFLVFTRFYYGVLSYDV